MSSQSDLVRVTLAGVPISTWKRASAHQDAIQREFDIILADSNDESVPRQLLDLVEDLDTRFGGVASDTWGDLYEAAERGEVEVDLVFEVPTAAAPASRELASMLARADEYCLAGEDLLSLATPPDLVVFRDWFLSEFTRQIEDGSPPTSWAAYIDAAQETKQTAVTTTARNGSETIVFEGELDLMSAGGLRDQILARRSEADPSSLTLDMRALTFVDSVGVSLLVTTYRRLLEDGAQLHVILPERVRPVFEISGLVDVLQPQFVSDRQTPALD